MPSPDPDPITSESKTSRITAPDELVSALIQAESSGNPNAVSNKGALGLAQAMPHTSKDPGYGVQPLRNPRDPDESKRFAKDYLSAMLNEFGGNPTHALMAYNWGPGNVRRWLRGDQDPSDVPEETRNYVRKLAPVASMAMNVPVDTTVFSQAKERGEQTADQDAEKALRKARKRMVANVLGEGVARADATRVAREKAEAVDQMTREDSASGVTQGELQSMISRRNRTPKNRGGGS